MTSVEGARTDWNHDLETRNGPVRSASGLGSERVEDETASVNVIGNGKGRRNVTAATATHMDVVAADHQVKYIDHIFFFFNKNLTYIFVHFEQQPKPKERRMNHPSGY